jgi:hypothetical protein
LEKDRAMTEDQNPTQSSLRDDTEARLPAAAYLHYEGRADGWSAGRQAAFLSHLADNGVVADAAAVVGKHQSGGYALRRQSRGYAFNVGWEAALLIARRVVADAVMAAAIKGETARWVREDGVTTYTRQNTKLSLALLDRVNPATTLPEVMAVVVRFDWFLELIEQGASGQVLWDYFFDDALPHTEHQARARVRAALLLSEDCAGFDGDDDDDDDAPIEYKSMEGAPVRNGGMIGSHQATKTRRRSACAERISSLQPPVSRHGCNDKAASPRARPLGAFVSMCETESPITFWTIGQSSSARAACAGVPRFNPVIEHFTPLC